MPSHNLLQCLLSLDQFSTGFQDELGSILDGEEYKGSVSNLREDDLVLLVDYLDKTLDDLDPTGSGFRKCLHELRHICGTRAILPTSYIVSPSLLNVDRYPVASGGSGDVYKGILNGSEVCVKRARVYSKDGQVRAAKTLYQEAVIWKRLKHENIVPLLGVASSPLQLISEWIPGGDLTEYIKEHPGADRLGLLCDVAEGLHFLHSHSIVHGDLKGPNILVGDDDHARITDFGLATVTQNLNSARNTSDHQGHTTRWTAPEILNEQGTYSKEADIFSFAMVAIEAFTGAVPFNDTLSTAATMAIMGGKRPPRPTHPTLTDGLWTLVQHCWDQDPHRRPGISKVLKVLNNTVTTGQQALFTGSKYGTDILFPEFQCSGAGPDGDLCCSVDQQGGQPNGRVSRRPSRRSTAGSGPSSMPANYQSSDLSKPQNNLGDCNSSRRGVTGKGSRPNLNRGLGDNGEGKYRSGTPWNNLAAYIRKTREAFSHTKAIGDPWGSQARETENTSDNTLDRSDPPVWTRSISDTLSTHDRQSLPCTTFSHDSVVEVVGNIRGDNTQTLVNMPDRALIPQSLVIPPCYNPTETPLYRGRFADVWKGQHDGREVAAKVQRVCLKNDLKQIRQRFCREVITWNGLRHPNVLPLLGVTMTEDRFVMVSEWMINGNINEFLRANISADRLKLLRDATKGLIYMHDQGIVHGDLKGADILIDSSGSARLADFSLVTITSDQPTSISSYIEDGTTQWMSPELLDPEMFGLKMCRPTKESDCYALGMVIYEVLSGRMPFTSHTAPVVIWKVLNGERPKRPQGSDGELFTDSVWRVVEHCWKPQPCDRISADAVLLGLQRNLSPLRPSFKTGGDAGPGSNYQQNNTAVSDPPPIPHGDSGLPDRLQPYSPKEGRTGKNLARKIFKATTGKLHGH